MSLDAMKPETLLRWQQQQFQHDRRNHTDIICLSRMDRLKHYGLHYAKYAGRVALHPNDLSVLSRTLVDALLVMLSAANVLSQRLDRDFQVRADAKFVSGLLEDIADASGRFCDACEKIDHFEEFLPIAKQANLDMLQWIFVLAAEHKFDLEALVLVRRQQLTERQFLIPADQQG
ncbi:hypothetical protein EPK99_04610 [Neorhizobium lilium]|uniref:Uncharacterized protein n=1 Tax=Neorhizobium lilium TaxID=2503024 RepID=A0A3S3VQ66_9HYPH|nr:hypothetical protein [Neorhizobium lilium]RWX81567.1 hypothetical protein EPK99_04610 [Neorhizobium lilium]